MNALRHPVFLRAVSLLLFAGAGVACVPVASASTAVDPAFESELRATLGDSEAVEIALEAARRLPTPGAALDAFVRVYTSVTGDADAAQEIRRLLQDHPNRFGAPALPPNQAVWTAASATPQILLRSSHATLVQSHPVACLVPVGSVDLDVQDGLATPHLLRTQQPRAP